MSYGSTFVQFEANGRISQKFSRPNLKKDQFPQERTAPKVVHYEKQFDVSLTRVDGPVADKASVRESMLAYSKKMRSLQDSRFGNGNTSKGDPLFVRAKHIPKYPVTTPKKRRPMSFDELLGRDRDTVRERPGGARQRPNSEKIKPTKEVKSESDLHLPLLSERLRKSSQNVQVSLVSASDLYDIVDFSLRSKGTRNDSLNMMKLEQEVGESSSHTKSNTNSRDFNSQYDVVIPEDPYNGFERRADTGTKGNSGRDRNAQTYVDNSLNDTEALTEDFYKDIFSLDKNDPNKPEQCSNSVLKLPSIPAFNYEPFKVRPRRVKRMKLIDPGLGDIPEDNVVDIQHREYELKRNRVRVVSPPPLRRASPKSSEQVSSLDVIQENVERVSVQDFRDKRDSDGEKAQYDRETYQYDNQRHVSSQNNKTFEGPGHTEYHGLFPPIDDGKSTKKVLQDDGDVRIEVTQCPPKQEAVVNVKLKAQKRFKKLIFLRDGAR